MAKINVENNTKMPMFIGSSMIPPGEIRQFEEHEVPLHLRPKRKAAAQEAPKTPDEALAKAIREAATASLPGGEYHGREDYVVTGIAGHFKAAEADVREKLRVEVAAAAKAAAEKRLGELAELVKKPVDEIREAFAKLSDQDLTSLEKLEQAGYKPRKGLLEAISAELLQRASGGGQG